MRKLLDKYRKNGSRVIRSSGKNPNLLIIGENHLLNTHVSPKDLFCEVQPKYFFCEGVQAGLEMSLAKYQSTRVDQQTNIREGTFEDLIHDALYDIGRGFAGVALTQWFTRSPKTTFVGIDLADSTRRSDEIVEASVEAVEELDGYVAEMLDLHGHELTDEQYGSYEAFRDFLYGKDSSSLDAYGAVRKIEEIRKNAPRNVLNKSGVRSLFTSLKRESEQLNVDREKTMGQTMVDYVSEADEISLAVVGAYHIRRSSHIFPILDSGSIEYLAIDIHKKADK